MNENVNQSLAVQEPKQALKPYIPSLSDIQSMEKMCQLAARSNFLTSSAPMSNPMQREADAFFVAMYGLELGVPFITSLRMIYVIDGKPACASQLLLGLMLKHGVKVVMPNPGTVTDSATVTIQRPNSPAHDYTFTKEMAVTAGLWGNKKNWKNSPREMLIWRAVAMAGRMECPDIVGGLYSLEELSPDTEVDSEGALVGNVVTSTATKVETITVQPEEIKHDPNEWINGNVAAWVSNYEAQGVTAETLKTALKITERWSEWKGTVSQATEAVEAYRKPATLPPDVAAAKAASKPADDAPKAEPAELTVEQLRIKELEAIHNEAATITEVEKGEFVKGKGLTSGFTFRATAYVDTAHGSQKIEFTLYPEDVAAIKAAGYSFPVSKGLVPQIPVILLTKDTGFKIRIDREHIEPAIPQDGKGKTSQEMFNEIPGEKSKQLAGMTN